VRRLSCQALAELWSAYLDGALPDAERERLLAHLVDCEPCRRELADLRAVRALLARSDARSDAPADLPARLASIAGGDSGSPLWTRPFRRTAPGVLPSVRRSTRLRVAAAGLVLASVGATAVGAGYAASPYVAPPEVVDPMPRALAEFASVLAQFPLANDAATALLLASPSDLDASVGPPPPVPVSGERLDKGAAVDVLQRAVRAGQQTGYRGTQRVQVRRAGRTLAAEVSVAAEPGRGTELRVESPRGGVVLETFVPVPAAPRLADDEMVSLLARTHTLTATAGATVGTRQATVVEAARKGSVRPAARWWLDRQTGLALWWETYDRDGARLISGGFSAIEVDPDPRSSSSHFAPTLATPVTTATLTLSTAESLSRHGWYCTTELAGLSLVRLRTDAADKPDAVHVVYSDGLSTIGVFEQRGTLVDPGRQATWDPAWNAFVNSGTTTTATWQSGSTVFTVVSDASPDIVAAAVSALPQERPAMPTTIERVRAGWVRIVEHISG
jgi:negative regulator of sigma E activity